MYLYTKKDLLDLLFSGRNWKCGGGYDQLLNKLTFEKLILTEFEFDQKYKKEIRELRNIEEIREFIYIISDYRTTNDAFSNIHDIMNSIKEKIAEPHFSKIKYIIYRIIYLKVNEIYNKTISQNRIDEIVNLIILCILEDVAQKENHKVDKIILGKNTKKEIDEILSEYRDKFIGNHNILLKTDAYKIIYVQLNDTKINGRDYLFSLVNSDHQNTIFFHFYYNWATGNGVWEFHLHNGTIDFSIGPKTLRQRLHFCKQSDRKTIKVVHGTQITVSYLSKMIDEFVEFFNKNKRTPSMTNLHMIDDISFDDHASIFSILPSQINKIKLGIP
jgi:hypothetical protein